MSGNQVTMNTHAGDLAPITGVAWQVIAREAKRTLKTMLAARRIVDLVGPRGFATSATGVGRLVSCPVPDAPPRKGPRPVELREIFTLPHGDIEAISGGARDIDLAAVHDAACAIATAENNAIFHGHPASDSVGLCRRPAGSTLSIGEDHHSYPALVARAVDKMRDAGIDGPYAVALSEQCFTALAETTKAGSPILEHVRRIIDGPIVWTPGMTGAAVVSLRGGDFELVVGQDFSIGYIAHDCDLVQLFISESFSFRLVAPQAAVTLAHPGARITAKAAASRRDRPSDQTPLR
jgi:uncharacterized linocin/CFP29 family protein